MEIFIFLVVAVVVAALFLRWIIVVIAAIIAMISGGFFVGLGVGLLTYFLLNVAKWISLAYLTAKAVTITSNQPDTKEQTCTTHKSKS